jgi:hypothetical protein
VSRNWNYAVPNVSPRVPESLSFVPGQPMGVLQVVGLQPTGGNRAVISRLLLATTEVQAGYQVSHIHGRHSLKMGAGAVGTQTNPSLDVNRRGYYYFTSLVSFLKGTPAAANLTTPQSLSARSVTQMVGHAFLRCSLPRG